MASFLVSYNYYVAILKDTCSCSVLEIESPFARVLGRALLQEEQLGSTCLRRQHHLLLREKLTTLPLIAPHLKSPE